MSRLLLLPSWVYALLLVAGLGALAITANGIQGALQFLMLMVGIVLAALMLSGVVR